MTIAVTDLDAAQTAPSFTVVPGAVVHQVLDGARREVIDVVEEAYRTHGAGATVNPPSSFLRFPERPASRIIALPASAGGAIGVDGIKWISSFPENIASGLPRASAVMILNDQRTGYPTACLEASIISAARTAASAALAARTLTAGRPAPRRLGIVGAGLISRYVYEYLQADGWEFERIGIHDLSTDHAGGLRERIERDGVPAEVHPDAESLVRGSDLIVFATVAATPHIDAPEWFDHHPVVLHVSLRDLAPSVIRAAANFVDDADHCLRAATSVHLTEQETGNRNFLAGTLYDVLTGAVAPPATDTIVFSPFGLGVLDLAVAKLVHGRAQDAGAITVDGFFHELRRHG
ncbi:ornithine cyclodeaminase [Amycolatopsis mediterranei S699]|uniref:Ornithine cyclodeaminase n=2 Tax=Amycolatopsis mediterranei TaxID=33910 RepID=A0A0H3D8C1_AMYMU|nr:2,3-diaminopropionate biosynthesis protein SbnB [Amycolatopsis mediterranei]ADJ46562.1 ornithine cyclodeaminase [Amycolatopsis mediterranei U32]AEK43363.1 ornithine cyclodeaminase [Amycolatopsis mediterranei S699]AFO78273.1 ornithine cyclodeaminase [Amycolatopsis mediterranei S699]AGT85401.1 ornithine cyclodeaminase [Amycolatopsis mediterranei RB]UZF71700.1 2,3-diaminopropionate biosynthesis protein SbnB [Amycolatopsis mediterranei]